MKRIRTALVDKAALIDLIASGYKHGIGPTALARLTGYSRSSIKQYAARMGVRMTTNRPMIPDPLPVEFLIVCARFGLSARTLWTHEFP